MITHEAMKNILVTGATGNVGRAVVSQLLERSVKVRAMARRPESASLPREVELVRGDLTEPSSLDECLRGIDAVFLVWIVPDTTLGAALQRIAKHAPHVVFLSNLTVRDDAEDQSYFVTALHARIERMIEQAGVSWTFLRPGAFATNTRIWWAEQIRAGGVVRWPYADAAMSPIHERDIAAVGVCALCDGGHAGKRYILTGPESLTQRDEVRIIGQAIGRPLRFEEIPPEATQPEVARVLPPVFADMLLKAFRAAVGKPAPVTSGVLEVTGRPARTFREWAVDHAAEFRDSANATPKW
jgi:uncharacterized protein YbjT (DUF2867 family)